MLELKLILLCLPSILLATTLDSGKFLLLEGKYNFNILFYMMVL